MAHNIDRNRATIDVDGRPRHVWNAELTKHGDLMIFLPAGGLFVIEDTDVPTDWHRKPIKQQRYSVHRSPRIPEGNMIKHTVEVDGREHTTVHFTGALKSEKSFAPLFCRIVGSHLVDADGQAGVKIHSLGRYEPAHFSLCYFLFVGRRDRPVSFPDARFFNTKCVDVGDFKIVTIWGFFSARSREGQTWHVVTTDPEKVSDADLLENTKLVMGGADELNMVNMFCEIGTKMMKHITADEREHADLPSGPPSSEHAVDLWRDGYRGSASWNEMVLRSSIRKMINVPPL